MMYIYFLLVIPEWIISKMAHFSNIFNSVSVLAKPIAGTTLDDVVKSENNLMTTLYIVFDALI